MTEPNLVRRLGLFDATMLVMGGIVSSPGPIVGVWLIGSAPALDERA